MKKLNLNFLIFLFLSGILISCAQNTKDAESEKEIAAIKELYDQYLHCVSTNNLDSFISLWTDDATRSEPGIPAIIGKENIRAHFKPLFDSANYNMVYAGETKVEVCGDLGYAIGIVTLSATPKKGGSTTVFDTEWLDIVKRQDDNSWKIFIDCVNFQPTWSKDSIPSELLDEPNPYY